MEFLTETQKESLSIRRMIFHIVGTGEEPVLLSEIKPIQHGDFFLGRVKSALKGNLFSFKENSPVEKALRSVSSKDDLFVSQSKELAVDFDSRHSGITSPGAFFLFELSSGGNDKIFALIKYDNEDVVRYVLDNIEKDQPKLERFQETFVKKTEAMQKIALVRLGPNEGGELVVKDRSNRAHISDYFEGFLRVKRVNNNDDLSQKLVEALKDTFRKHQKELPEDIAKEGIHRIFRVVEQGNVVFDPDDCEPLITSIFGYTDEKSKLRKTLERSLKDRGVFDETFEIDPKKIKRPRRKKIETSEGAVIQYDDSINVFRRDLKDGNVEVGVITAKIISDDYDSGKN